MEYGNNYFLFLVLGIGTVDLLSRATRAGSVSLRESQTLGYVEMILNSKISIYHYIVSTMIYPLCFGLFRFFAYLLLAYFFSPFELSVISALTTALIIISVLISFVGVTFMSCAFVLNFKQGDPINYLVTTAITLFAGVLFPVPVLPDVLQYFSSIIPVTHGLELIRKIIIYNSLEHFTFSSLGLIFAFMITTTIIGVLSLRVAINRVKTLGTSGDY